MRPIDLIEGKVSVLDRNDVDTDQIIPKQFQYQIEPDVKHRLLNGLDDIGITLQNVAAIDDYEDSGRAHGPATTAI